MLAAVVPAKNESAKIMVVLEMLLALPVDIIIPVINGSTDQTLETIVDRSLAKTHILYFPEALGVDVPRAAGAFYAFNLGANSVLFIDGDMAGALESDIIELSEAVRKGTDMALAECYPQSFVSWPMPNEMLKFRRLLNQKLGIFAEVGLSSPSHGPHAVSRRLLKSVPLKELAIPPVSLALAVAAGLTVKQATYIPHMQLDSTIRDSSHADAITETIIGDCLEALCIVEGKARSRFWGKKEYMGYHGRRRFDILGEIMAGKRQLEIYRTG